MVQFWENIILQLWKNHKPAIRIGLALILLIILLSFPPTIDYLSYSDILSHTAMTLKGQAPYSDVATDFYGFRALISNNDPYAPLKAALKTMGIDWNIEHSSTHPPTSFLLVAPVAMLPWPVSSMVWGWLMVVCLCLGLWIGLDYTWDLAILITVMALYWPPISTSVDQITNLWLLGLAVAYKYRNSNPFVSGTFIGFASLGKFLPGVLLIPFVFRRKWDAVAGFAVTWVIALGVLVMLSPKAIMRYLEANRTNSLEIIMRKDNSSFLYFLDRRIGLLGVLITVGILFVLFLLAVKKYHQTQEGGISTEEWNIHALLSIMLLPITWIYSVGPLLPNLLLLLRDTRMIIRILTICAFIPPIILPPWGPGSTLGIFGCLVFAGMAMILAQSNIGTSSQPTGLLEK